MQNRALDMDTLHRRLRAYRRSIAFVCALSCIAGATSATAKEGEAIAPKPAIWIEPSQMFSSQSGASWIDTRPSVAEPTAQSRIVATGANDAIVESMGAYWLIDASFKTQTPIEYPSDMRWTSVDESGRISAFANETLYAQSSSGDFVPVLSLPGVRVIDGADSVVAYADAQKLSIADLAQGTVRTIALTDFFDDEKVAQMTPEAVAQAEAAANKKGKKAKQKQAATKTGQDANDAPVAQIAEMTGIWWRHDGVGVVRVRSILNVRTFITTDNGRTWRRSDDAPDSLTHEFGLIWDSQSRVLSADATRWIDVAGKTYAPADRFLSAQSVEIASDLPEHWTRLESPKGADNSESTAIPESNSESTCQNPDGSPCVKLPLIAPQADSPSDFPIMRSQASGKVEATTTEGLYAPKPEAQGLRLWLTRDARCLLPGSCTAEAIQAPRAWMQRPDDAAPIAIELPRGCLPRYIGAQKGLGIVFCDKSSDSIGVYTRSASSDWALETELPAASVDGNATRIFSGDDGTLIVVGQCSDEAVAPAAPAETSEAELPPAPATPAKRICNVAIRRPNEIGIQATPLYRATTDDAQSSDSDDKSKDKSKFGDKSKDSSSDTQTVESVDESPTATVPTWRIERPENAVGYVPLRNGEFLTIESTGASSAHLLRFWAPEKSQSSVPAGAYSELLSESFDPAPFDGLVMTDEGCLSLYDSSSPPPQLLAVDGGFSNMTCADSRTIALEEKAKRDAQEQGDQAIGDDHYGLRLGAGGFFTVNDVQTWFMRIEALIPVYGGQYEVGLMYRMAGGNKSTAMGHIGMASVRWRYDGFELFDFAVGAGIGFGSMCGYEKPKDTSSEVAGDENESSTNRSKSGYEKCSTYSLRYQISGIATYKLNEQWKLFISAELLGGTSWGFDVAGGIEIRF